MNSSSFRKLIEERSSDTNILSLNRGVAHAIRMKRKEANLTQSEIADGICSVSYLSKIENGKCHPENYYVREIMNRMDIDVNDCLVRDFQEELEEFFQVSFAEDESMMEVLYGDALNQDAYAAKLVILGYNVLMGNPYKETMEYLNAYKSYLTTYELKAFMFFIALAEYKNVNYAHCMEFLDILSYVDEVIPEIDQWINLLRIKCSYWSGDYVKGLYYVSVMCELQNNAFTVEKLYEVQVYNCLLVLENNMFSEAKRIYSGLKRHKSIHLDQYYYLSGMMFFKEGRYEEAIREFIRVKNQYFEVSLLKVIECFYHLDNVDEMKIYLEILEEQTTNKLYQNLGKYFVLKKEEDQFIVKEFIQTYLMSRLKRTRYSEYLIEVVEELITFHRENSRYKAIDELRSKLK